jgi:hypothetical protein
MVKREAYKSTSANILGRREHCKFSRERYFKIVRFVSSFTSSMYIHLVQDYLFERSNRYCTRNVTLHLLTLLSLNNLFRKSDFRKYHIVPSRWCENSLHRVKESHTILWDNKRSQFHRKSLLKFVKNDSRREMHLSKLLIFFKEKLRSNHTHIRWLKMWDTLVGE